ncbi:hypothetical protein F7725_007261 [Dissostichus mawsoni]|uniref:Ig-like domain-containing protein n=1 Tax=Dissostichus mawsoni TaxID=36200 RepID=A0A7J5XXY9_DISMA|nr:hypothetical protein F7725_007261 [Dissostichus mawsoni]
METYRNAPSPHSLPMSLSLPPSLSPSTPKLFRYFAHVRPVKASIASTPRWRKHSGLSPDSPLSNHCYFSVLAVVLKTSNEAPWTDEFDRIELSCLIESISTSNPRIEWKKITNEGPSYVYFDKKISEPATLLITNATRSDTAKYRCEVTAADDQRSFDEIVIDLVVRVPFGKSAELSCVEEEGFPKSQYQWFKNKEEVPDDHKTSLKFFNSSYTLDADSGTLQFITVRKEDAGEYFCRAKNDAGYAECPPQQMEVYDIDILGILMGVLVVVIVLMSITAGICCAYKRGYFSTQKQTGNNYKVPAKGDGVDYVRTEDEVCGQQLD